MEINAQYKDMKIIYSHCLVKKVKLFEKYMLIKNLMSSNNIFFFFVITPPSFNDKVIQNFSRLTFQILD